MAPVGHARNVFIVPVVLNCVALSWQIPHYELEVQATDQGTPPLSSTTTVEVEVNDVNDNPPVFLQHPENYSAVVQVCIQRGIV